MRGGLFVDFDDGRSKRDVSGRGVRPPSRDGWSACAYRSSHEPHVLTDGAFSRAIELRDRRLCGVNESAAAWIGFVASAGSSRERVRWPYLDLTAVFPDCRRRRLAAGRSEFFDSRFDTGLTFEGSVRRRSSSMRVLAHA